MVIGVPVEITNGERRVAVIPATVKELIKNGLIVKIQSGAGIGSFISDAQFKDAGADIISSAEELFSLSDMIVKVNHPEMNAQSDNHEVDMMNEGSAFVSFFQSTKETNLVKKLQDKKITAFSMHLVPRTTLAQKMDALSSQSNIAGCS